MHEKYTHLVVAASRHMLEESAHGVIERTGKGGEERRAEISVFLAVFSHIFE